MSVLKLYNKDAYANNTLVLHKSKSGCCGSELEMCKYLIDKPITNVSAITLMVDGSPVVENFDPVNTPREIRKAVAKALRNQGYDPYYEDNWKGVMTSANKFSLIGDMVPISLKVNGVECEFEKRCDLGRICKCRGLIDFNESVGNLSFNGSAGTPISATAGGDPEGVKSKIKAALDAEGVEYSDVEVLEDASNQVYVFNIHIVGECGQVTVGGVDLVPCGCYPDFLPSNDEDVPSMSGGNTGGTDGGGTGGNTDSGTGGAGSTTPSNCTIPTGEFGVLVANGSGNIGDQICLPVTVKEFKDIIAMQFSLGWDATMLQFDSVQSFGLPGMSAAQFANTSNTASVAWDDASLVGVTLGDDSTVFEICFTVLANGSADVEVTNSPTIIEVIDKDSNSVTVNTCDGNITQ